MNGGAFDGGGPVLSKLGSSSTAELHPKTGDDIAESKPTIMPPASVMTRLILIMVWRKLIRNPNTYSSLIGLAWSLISFKYEKKPSFWELRLELCIELNIPFCRWNIVMPAIVARSIAILSDAGLGMAMFSLGIDSLPLEQ